MNIQNNGAYLIGEFIGYEERPWSNDPSKFNRRVGIKTGEYETGFGQYESNIQTVDIQMSDVPAVKAQAESLKGKRVLVPVVFRAKAGGRQGAFLSCFMPKEAVIEVIK